MQQILNQQQSLFAKSPLENSKLIGIPGGGKTTTIIHKILNHIDNKQIEANDDFLITSFSKKACEDFIEKGNKIRANIFDTSNTKTLHSLAGSIIHTILKKKCSSIQIAIISAINIIKTRTQKDLLRVKCLKNIKIIIVDEAQDMSDIQFELVVLLRDILNIKLVLVGDPNQSIYQFQNGSDVYLREYDGREYYLEENNRSSPEITKFLNYFRPWNSRLPPMISKKEPTKKLPIIFSGSQDDICMRIINEIKKSTFQKENIAIIGPVKKSDRKNDYMSLKFGLQKIANILTAHDIKFIKHYNESQDDDQYCESTISTIPKKDHVNLYTIHGSKGLEFDKVIIVNFHFKTFGKVPSLEEYNQFKYLWYVALSRAKLELLMCCDNDKLCWSEVLNCPHKLYQMSGDEPNLREPVFNNEIISDTNISRIISNKKIFGENVLLNFYKDINFSENTEQIFKVRKINDPTECETISENKYLVTQFVNCVFEYYYGLFHSCTKKIKFVEEIRNFLSNILFVNNKFKSVFVSFCAKCNLDIMGTITKEELLLCKNKFDKMERKLFEHVLNKIDNTKINTFSLALENDDIFMDSDVVLKICDDIFEYESEEKLNWSILKLCLFKYQYQHEAKYLWTHKKQFKIIPTILKDHIKQVKQIAITILSNYKFRIKCEHPNLRINGCIDMITENGHIALLKFSDSVDLTDKIKLFLYFHSYYNKYTNINNINKINKVIEIWNFKTGTRHILNFLPLRSNLVFSYGLSVICKLKLYNMIFVYDLETTGLNTFKCEIIERYIHELTHDVSFNFGIVKAKSKISKEIIKLTGISQKEVDNGQSLDSFKNEIKNILQICHNPIFIAHNGIAFDHQVMRAKNILDNTCVYLDSRTMIRQLSKNKIGNENLADTYEIIMGHKFKGSAHRAKADVIMLLDIFNKLNIRESNILKMS